jgi:hypothetical protein
VLPRPDFLQDFVALEKLALIEEPNPFVQYHSVVGRSPWTAADALVGLRLGTRRKKRDEGVRPLGLAGHIRLAEIVPAIGYCEFAARFHRNL